MTGNFAASDVPDLGVDGPSIDPIADAKRVFNVLQQGGLAIVPVDVGYAVVAMHNEALERAFTTKQRKPHKRHAMMGSWATHQAIHVLPPQKARMAKLLVKDLNLPLGLIAPFKEDHPVIKKLGSETLARSSVEGTLAMLVNVGPLVEELTRLALEANVPIMGSSANMTGKGTKSLVADIEPEILAAADIVIDYGRMKYSYPRTSSTMFDFKSMRLIRFGACYDVIKDAFKRFYHIELPEDPGRDALFSGHAVEQQNQY
jgi:tRNA A37 threonylcarbamoyladenosine synthetase subunit TsaC/SUA5/YrdC